MGLSEASPVSAVISDLKWDEVLTWVGDSWRVNLVHKTSLLYSCRKYEEAISRGKVSVREILSRRSVLVGTLKLSVASGCK